MFKRKVKEERYSVKEFLNLNKKPVIANTPFEFKSEMAESIGVLGGLSLIPLATKPFFEAIPAMAAEVPQAVTVTSTADMTAKLMHAFDPLITLIQAVAYPIALVVVLGGAIMVMMREPEKGFSMMQSAGLGYILVQMAPLVLSILVEATKLM
ncbi:hypothetical protein D0469_07070 [Peribacillus saganii]|uniref:Uncharacterized protein n=1 Tax=Peribacillus saganii TaxID=2303992 RepID=A0A372LQ67_9BACI|nr:hypothetical protein [Peribacillus saganii]RFU70355.1 hypothetical protein D0469_07070 [Peribacillus saganii]